MRLATAAILLFSAVAWAQVDTARIAGTVTDSTGARIPGAKVTIRNVETNISVETVTDAVGSYRSVPLRIGLYSVAASKEGFKTAVREGLRLEIQQEAVVDLVCTVGSVTEQIVVTADAPLLQTFSASRGQVIDNKKIIDLPLNGRDYLQLALLTAGASTPASGARFGGFSASGLRASHNNYLLDGMDNNANQAAGTGRTAQAVEPSIDAIAEFKVETNSYSAEYGRNVGGVVNVSIKAGTNKFHGSLFEFLRNEKLDAKNFFDSPDEPTPPYKRNQFGGSVGGPIIPNKTFFFFDYEGTKFHSSDTVQSTVPTERERRGDFSQSTRSGQPVRIFDPATYDNATRVRREFAGAVIPAERIDPVARAAIAFYPLPNQPGIINNFLYNPLDRDTTNKWDVRVDHTFNSRDSIYGRFSFLRYEHLGGPNLPPPAYGGGDQSTTAVNNGRSFALNHTHVFTPTLFNNLKLGYNRLLTERTSPTDENLNQQIGLKGLPFDLPGLAVFTINEFRALGTQASTPNDTDSQTRQIVDDLNWVRGRHTLRTGINFAFIQMPHYQVYQANGQLTFNGNFTRQTTPAQFGSPLADFLLGIPFSAQLSNAANGNQRRRLYHGYVQDEFRVTQRLTVNMGLRYEFTGPLYEKNNRYANFDIDTDPANPRLVLAKDGSLEDRALIKPDYNNFAPRFGIAWRLQDRTVIRAGYGIYFGGVDTYGDRYLHAGPPFFYQSTFSTDSLRPTIVLRDGYPPNAVTANVSNLQTISQQRSNPTPYAQNWNFTVQRQMTTNLALEVGYVASKGTNLLIRRDTNAPQPGAGNINTRRPIRSIDVPGLGVVTPLSDMFRREWVAHSNYHSLQAKLEKRLSAGLSFLTSYTWSKAISNGRGGADAGNTSGEPQDPYNLALERALADEHIPHRFVTSYTWDLPFGRGRRLLSTANRATEVLLGGWAVGGITTLVSGRTVTPGVQGNPSNTGTTNRPDQVGDPALSRSERSLQRWFNTSAFVANAQYTYGNAARNVIQAPGRVNFDFALYKSFPLAESVRLQFRAECFNLMNTPPFGAPNATVGGNGYGVISGAGDPRILQFGLRLQF